MKQDEEQRLLKVVETTKQEEQEMYQKQLEEMKIQLEHDKDVSLEEEKRITATVMEELEQVKQDKEEMELECEERKALQLKLENLEESLRELAVSKSEALDVAEMQKITLKEKLLEEIACYKEQSDQYAVTIAAMEEKLLTLMKKSQLLEKKNESLEQQMALHQQETSNSEKRGTATCTAAEKENTKARLEQIVTTLKHQLVLVSSDREQKQARVEQLEAEADTAAEQLHKNQAELQQQHLEQLLDLKRSLSDQEWIIEQQKQEITQLQCTMRQSKEQAVETQHEDVPAFLNVEQQSLQLQSSHDLELVTIGRKCIGEKHKDLIQHQRRTVQDLRQKLCDMTMKLQGTE